MLKTRIEQSGGSGSLVLEGEMIIDHGEELKRFFLGALESRGSLDLNLEGVSKVDLFGLQVLCSAHQSAVKANKVLTLIGKQPEALRDAVVMAGYGSTVACSLDKTCPWNEE
jgi:anti-anti-sigma regulatory factor